MPVRLLHLTDLHFPAAPGQTHYGVDAMQSFAEVLAEIRREGKSYDLALLTGDLTHEPSEFAYTALRGQISRLEMPGYCLPGNHDDADGMRRYLLGDAIRWQTRIVFPRWQILCLDSTVPGENGGCFAEEELERLETHLEEEPDRHALIAVHHPAIPTGSAWMDTMVIRNAERFLSLLARFPMVRAVLCGHVHQVIDRSLGTIRFLATPSTGFQFQPDSREFALDDRSPGYRWLELQDSGTIDTAVRRVRRTVTP